MTIGQRIAWIRKEHGLSQEAFGETFGVSRQAISKWESDSCIPDVDKLIALSRTYHVSVGWLLGVEEEKQEQISGGTGDSKGAEPEGESAGKQCAQMSEEQLRMVEEIVDRYLKALSFENKNVRRPWRIWMVSCVLILVLAAGMVLWRSIEELRTNDLSLTKITADLGASNERIKRMLDQLMKQQDLAGEEPDSLLATESCRISDCDLAAGTVTFTISVVPRDYRGDMTATFLAESAGEFFRVEGEEKAGSFQGQLTCALSNAVAVFVQIEANGEMRQQRLKEYSGMLDNSIPEEIRGSVIGILPQCSDGHLISNIASMELDIERVYERELTPEERFFVRYEMEEVQGVFYINDEEYAVYEAKLTESRDRFQVYRAEMPIDVMLEEGDILTAVGRITDEYGRVFERELARFEVKNGKLE